MTGSMVGRQTWRPDPSSPPSASGFVAASNPNSSDRLFRRQMMARNGGRVNEGSRRAVPLDAAECLREGAEFYTTLQTDDGHWAGDYGGPMFLMPGLVITAAVAGVDLGVHHRAAMTTYLLNHQQLDGGWGLHIESPSTMFGTVMNYVTLRLVGQLCDCV